mgnify:CR=1 FL=1
MPTREQVQQILEEKVAPRLAMDGGGIELVEVTEDGVVRVKLQGACQGCPGARMTLQMGVEKLLKDELPDVKAVEGV